MVGARQFNLMETTVNKIQNSTKTYQDNDFLKGSGAILGSAMRVGPQPAFEDARLLLLQANTLANRVLDLAERLCGGRPVDDGMNDIASAPIEPGAIELFRAQMRDTRELINHAENALVRIQQELVG